MYLCAGGIAFCLFLPFWYLNLKLFQQCGIFFVFFYFISLGNEICFIFEDIGDFNRYQKWKDSSWLTSGIANAYWSYNISRDQSHLDSVLQKGKVKVYESTQFDYHMLCI